jgi:predicted DNA-binding WGR domain protein
MLRRSSTFLSLAVAALLTGPVFGQPLVVELDASHASAGTATWTNTAGAVAGDNFTLIGEPFVEMVAGATAVTFDGVDDAYQMIDPAPASLVGVDPPRSIEVWALNPSFDGEEAMVAWGHRGADGKSMSFNFGAGGVTHWGPADFGWSVIPSFGGWHHLVYSFDGSTVRLYEDGEFHGSKGGLAGLIDTPPSHITIASQLCDPAAPGCNPGDISGRTPAGPDYHGSLSIARVRVYSGALTAEQVLNNFNAEKGDFGIPTLVVELDARHESAGTATWTNTAGVGAGDNFNIIGEPTVGMVAGSVAVTFDGVDDAYQMIDTAPASLVGVDPPRSIEVWALNPSFEGEEAMVAWGHRGADGKSMSFNFGAGGVTHWGPADFGWSTLPSFGEWHHLVYTFDGSTVVLYEDGEFHGSKGGIAGLIDTPPSHITVASQLCDPAAPGCNPGDISGQTPAGPEYHGSLSIARVRVWSGALTAGQVLNTFNAEKDDFVNLIPGDLQIAGELFVELDPVNFVEGDVWTNTGTLGDFDRIFGVPELGSFNGTPGVVMDTSAIQGPFAPDGLVGSSDRTVEVWAMNLEINDPEETMVAWGRRGGPDGTTETFCYGQQALTHWGAGDLGWGAVPALGEWHHLVYTYDGGTERVYSDGLFVVGKAAGLQTFSPSRLTIGSQLCKPFSPGCNDDDIEGESLAADQYKASMTIGKIRIHDGVLQDFQIAHNHSLERECCYVPDAVAADITNAPKEDTIFVGTQPYNAFLVVVGSPPPLVEILSPDGASLALDGTFSYPIPDPNTPGSFEVSIRVSNGLNPTGTTVSWTVTSRNPPNPGDPIETAGEVFVDVDASDATAGDANWANAGTLGDLVEVGDPVKARIFGADALALNLDGVVDAYTTQEDAPDGLIGKNPTRTIEVWGFNPSFDGEEGMVAWGKRDLPDGSVLGFNYPPHSVTHWGFDVAFFSGPPPPTDGAWHHLVYTHDGATTRVYFDGTETSSRGLLNLIDTSRTKIFLGSQINADGVTPEKPFSGYLSRVRVHDGILRPEQVAHNFSEELPDFTKPQIGNPPVDEMAFDDRPYRRRVVIQSAIPANVALVGSTPPDATLEVDSNGGGGAAGVFSVDVQPGENVVVVVPIGAPPPASFNVDLTVVNASGQDNASWTVTLVTPPTRPEGIEVAGELYVDLDAIHPSAGEGGESWANAGTLGDFVKIGHPLVTFHNGFAGVAFNSFAIEDAYQSQEGAPAGLVGIDPTRSVEVWAFNPEIGPEEAMVAWGGRSDPAGSNMSFNYGNSTNLGAVNHWGGDPNPNLPWGPMAEDAPTAGAWHHLVYTLDGTTARVYSDGELVNEKQVGGQINTDTPSKITLGAQNDADRASPVFDPDLVGRLSLAIVRVHDGVLSEDQIDNNFTLGMVVESPFFRRGDHDGSGLVDITDSLNRLGFLFLGTTPSDCQDASDFDNSGAVDISDSLNELTFLFLGTVIPPDPGTTNCGPDPDVEIDDGDDPPPNGPDGLPLQPAVSLDCDEYPNPDFLPAAACP